MEFAICYTKAVNGPDASDFFNQILEDFGICLCAFLLTMFTGYTHVYKVVGDWSESIIQIEVHVKINSVSYVNSHLITSMYNHNL